MRRKILLSLLYIALLSACQPVTPLPTLTPTPLPKSGEGQGVRATAMPTTMPGTLLEPEGFIQRTHDPVIAKENDTYYVFSTGGRIPFICSKDKITWEFCGRVFEQHPAWTREINRDLADIWAPDISYFDNQWHLYYAVSTFGSQNSAIGLATNATLDPKSPDYKWVDQGIVLRSNPGDQWNAIDPNLVLDEKGETWLAWGSYWHGLWMRKIDPATGKFDDKNTEFHHLADRSAGPGNNPAIEGVFIIPHNGKWYLLASFDQCCQGKDSTYNVRVGRSDTLTGPYVDRDGVPLLKGGGTRILSAYDRWAGPGHNGMLIEDGVYWMVYHAYDIKQVGIPKLRIESLGWDAEVWPVLASQTLKP